MYFGFVDVIVFMFTFETHTDTTELAALEINTDCCELPVTL